MMRAFTLSSALLCFSCLLSNGLEAALPPLPEWNEADKVRIKKGELVVGRALLTLEGEPASKDSITEDAPPAADVEEQPAETIVPVPERPELDPISRSAVGSEIPEKLLERYFGKRGEPGLIDPQHLLSMQEGEDMRYAFRQHGEESELPIYFFLFDADQRVPDGYSQQLVYEKWFGAQKEPVVLIYYFLGQPSRTQFFLGGTGGGEIPEWQLNELLTNAAHTAREKSDVFNQLDDFVGQLSMRLFWVEKMLEDALRKSLQQDVPAKPQSDERPHQNLLVEKLQELGLLIQPYFVPAMASLAIITGVFAFLLWWIFRRRFIFPVTTTMPPRLGGDQGAYYGGVISFKRNDQPPSDQKRQFDQDIF